MPTPYTDAMTLRSAARILRDRSKRPRSILLAALCRLLTDTADKIESEA